MQDTGAIVLAALFAIGMLVLVSLPLSVIRRIWLFLWRISFEVKPRPAALGQQISTMAGALVVMLMIGLIAWHGGEELNPEQAAQSVHYISLGAILAVTILLVVLVLRHHKRRSFDLLDEPEEDARINKDADSARVPALVLCAVAAAGALLYLVPWPNSVERYPGASYEELAQPSSGLVDVIAVAPVRIDDLGDTTIRINYLGYALPVCDRLVGATIVEDQTSISVSVQLGHHRGNTDACSFSRSLFVNGMLGGGSVQYFFEEQLRQPVGDREIVLLP